ncbi:Nucleic acid-binding, OB-fold protein [Metarhizium rileyi]|uniref:Nucleic acid-binding, OB-fold protein n=1 Tax=Metarhizium rileyi (strain RCEF 4871) TaxID=1649241 RepID=A0A162I3N9_METRR|nr:Nucleic acid-binding, OB-fold protein [Metarhizium rileyi RCEF 4871]
MPPPKLLLFTGPPPSSTLTESSCSLHDFDKPFRDLLGLQAPWRPGPPQTQYTAWRSLPLSRHPLHTGLSQVHHRLGRDTPASTSTAFFTTADTSSTRDLTTTPGDQDVLTQFCEHSLAAHASDDAASERDTLDTTDAASFMTTSLLSQHGRLAPPVPAHLSDLEDVPPAKQVTALQPQTVTLNMVVGVLSVAQPRTVTTRWGSTLSLVEVLVGDETAAGFAVTFWVPTDRVAGSDVVALRRQDVVLMENVALHVFRDKVYGQSLRKGLTRLHLLWRAGGGGYYSTRSLTTAGDENPQTGKVSAVKDWVLRFVGLDGKTTKRRKVGLVDWDRPPDDTQQ